MSFRQTIFLDTSIQIERYMGPHQERVAIERTLADSETQFVTSNYVLMEFQRSILSNYIYVYNQILANDDWETTAYAIRSGRKGYRPRAMGQCFQILTAVIDKCERNQRHALEFLKIHITQDLSKRFWRNVTKLPDPIVCDLIQSGVTRQTNGNYSVADSCRKATAACHLLDFFAQNKAKLHMVSDYLSKNSNAIKGQGKIQQLVAKVIEELRAVLGQSICWPLGDLIIALQVPAHVSLWSIDADFKSLADALGFSLYDSGQSE